MQTIREQQVAAARGARQEAARTFLMPGLGSPLVSGRAPNGLKQFSTFEYIPSRYSLADELAARARVESEAKRMVVSVCLCVYAGGCCARGGGSG
eukprot:363192-Chlamydomonas_euryale.AAC.6